MAHAGGAFFAITAPPLYARRRDAALAEVRRRWPSLAEPAVARALDRVLKLKVEAAPEAMRRDDSAAAHEMRLERERTAERLRRFRREQR